MHCKHSTAQPLSVGLTGISHYDNQRQFIQHHIMELSLLMSRVQYNTGYTTTCPEIVCATATHFATCTVQHQFNKSTFYRYLANTLIRFLCNECLKSEQLLTITTMVRDIVAYL